MAWSTTAEGMLDFANQHFLDYIACALTTLPAKISTGSSHPDDVAHLGSAWQSIMASKVAKEVEGRNPARGWQLPLV